MIKVISSTICPFVQRVTALLEAKRIPYEIEYIDLANKPAWFTEISPHGQVPVVITASGVALFESDAIVEYIDEITEPLAPDLPPEDRALQRAWSQLATKNYLVQCSAMRSEDRKTLEERSKRLGAAFEKIEAELGDGPYFAGDSPGNVDITWLVLLHRAEIIKRHAGYDFLEDYPKVRKWQAALMSTGLAGKSVAEDFEDVFTGFYLSDKTFLGGNEGSDNAMHDCCNRVACCG